jgi:hypothetical protein
MTTAEATGSPPDLADGEQAGGFHLERAGSAGPAEADLLGGGAVGGVRGHGRAGRAGDPGGVKRDSEASGQGFVGDGRRVGGEVVAGGALVADSGGEQDDVAGFLAGLDASGGADADAAACGSG